ncbi:M23 family metallopeptidase [Alkaliphilus sp. B6464]|uniref:M23 family metallopeptidase n=1 Tax=Alkaliphilus sp. B6464 TaxID=2731219 RepID=UPI001BA87926|nr:M23 family metallopeptidase [Alkaliphilus sp. B6464]QUH19281.1 peptidoglycan DD-metalloendopeptidase family protein [Alkaliphilus sp. B6464]
METKISEKVNKFSKKITTEMKSFYNKCKNIDTKLFYNKVKSVELKSLYNKFKCNKKLTYRAAGVAAISISLVSGIYLQANSSIAAYNVEVDDNILAVVKTEEEFLEALKQVKEEAISIYGQDVVMSEEPSFIETKVKRDEITKVDEMIKNIKEQIDIKLKATAIKVEGEEVVIVKDQKTALNILDSIKAPFLEKEESEYDEIDFSEKVEIVEVGAEFSEIIDEEEALQKIAIGTDEEKIHEVESGENPWTIARKYDLKIDDIIKANPGMNPERIQIGQKISLIVPKPLVSVRTKEYIELVEEIPFDTEYEETASLYKGDKKITVQGAEGKREIKGYIVKENGAEVNMEVVDEKIISEPKTRVIAQGTKERPATMATGAFSNPTRGRLTSPFGMRWGRRHTGIDIASSRGTTVSAADAGKVSFAGKNGSYGNLVIIDHENGYQTYYAHNNKLIVKKGDRVYKGQKIAEMGNTGRSTGVHLHFEVRKNGTPINPQGFVSY